MDTELSALVSFASLFGSRPVIGRVTESSIRLRKRIGYRNSFQTFLTATLRWEAGATVISGKVNMHRFVQVFMFIWFTGAVLIGGPMFVVSIASLIPGSTHQMPNAWMGVVMPPVIVASGYGLVRFGRYLARNEAGFLKDFLMRTLDAREMLLGV